MVEPAGSFAPAPARLALAGQQRWAAAEALAKFRINDEFRSRSRVTRDAILFLFSLERT